jgi:hypothetical protein
MADVLNLNPVTPPPKPGKLGLLCFEPLSLSGIFGKSSPLFYFIAVVKLGASCCIILADLFGCSSWFVFIFWPYCILLLK